MRLPLAILGLSLMSACTIAEQVAQDTIRQEAKSVINGLVAERMPGLNAAPITDCIIDSASTAEILTIGQAAVTGVTPATTTLVFEIAQRPDTVACISTSSLSALGL